MALLDVILGYDCNLACDFCTITPAMRERALPATRVAEELTRARADGFDSVQFTGGEPTIRRDLTALIRAARRVGFETIKVQSNGLLWTTDNLARVIEAGANSFSVSIHSHREDVYERVVRRSGTFASMRAGLEALVAADVDPSVDLIIKSDSQAELAGAVDWIADRGVRRVDLWFVSLTDGNAENLASMPRMSEVMPHVHAAIARANARGLTLRSLHLPVCLLGDEAASHAWDPAGQGVRVLTPDACFDLAQSKLTPQKFVPACEGCPDRPRCPGLREDYLARYGDHEIAAVRGQAPTLEGQAPPAVRGVRAPGLAVVD